MKILSAAAHAVCCCASFAACEQDPRVSPPSKSSLEAPTLPVGWQIYPSGGISFAGPADLVDEHAHGVDSAVGRFSRDGMQVTFDYGSYSDSSFSGHFDGKTMKSGHREGIMIDSRPAWLATYADNVWPAGLPLAVEVYVPDAGRSEASPSTAKLQFKVVYRDEKDAETARAVALSVRFDKEKR